MLFRRLQRHQIDYVDKANLQIGQGSPQQVHGRQRLEVGISPAHAITTSGSPSLSLLAHSQMPMPAVQCLMAASMSRYCSAGCFPATMTLIKSRLRRQWSVTESSVLASGGR